MGGKVRLTEVTVRNYRSIGKQTKFSVGDLTTLVGPNNEGKSNLLRALRLGMTIIERWSALPDRLAGNAELRGFDASHMQYGNRPRDGRSLGQMGYVWLDDFPLDRQERTPRSAEVTVLRLQFHLDEDEVRAFKTGVGVASNNGELPIEIKLGERMVSLNIVKQGRGSQTHRAKSREIAEFIASRLSLVSVPPVRTAAQARELVNDLARIRILELTQSDLYVKLTKELSELVQACVDEVAADLTESVKRFVPSIKKITLTTTDVSRRDSIEDVIIDDGSKTTIAHKGDGVKSLVTLALIQEFARKRSTSHSFILAVDEPEAHLHSAVVHQLHLVLQELSETQQVILATHNPIFVNREDVASNVIVRSNTAKPAKSRKEIREVLGVEPQDNLESADTVVFVEGLTDEEVLKKLLIEVIPASRSDLRDGRVVLKSVMGASKMRSHIVRERTSVCRIIAVFDGDISGVAEAERLAKDQILTEGHIHLVRDGVRTTSELEDLVEPDVYLAALGATLDRTFVSGHFANPNKKWSENLSDASVTLGVVRSGQALKDTAKVAVAQCVKDARGTVLKPSAFENIRALATLIWPDMTPVEQPDVP